MATEKSSFWGNLIMSALITITVILVSIGASGPQIPMEGSENNQRTEVPRMSDQGQDQSLLPSSPPPSFSPQGNYSLSEAAAVLSYYAATIDGQISEMELSRIRNFVGRNWASRQDLDQFLSGLQESYESGRMEANLKQALEDISRLPNEQQTEVLTEIWRFMQQIGMELTQISQVTTNWIQNHLSINIYDLYDSLQN